jgi:hypothetical protein
MDDCKLMHIDQQFNISIPVFFNVCKHPNFVAVRLPSR